MSGAQLELVESMTGGPSLDHLPFGAGETLIHVLEMIAVIIDLIGVSIILFGFVIASIRLIGSLRHGLGLKRNLTDVAPARAVLGVYILTGLEFMIASDIVHTVTTRAFSDLLFVGLLVIIRTAISFFLGKEIMEIHHEESTRRSRAEQPARD